MDHTASTLSAVAACLGIAMISSLAAAAEFDDPFRMEAGGDFVKVESPGYAAPCWVDLDQDGHGDLVVGQFAGGKMKVFRGSEGGLTTGEWLKAEGKVAEVPGVW